MNDLAQMYHDKSRPIYCANRGFVDEIVFYPDLRKYISAFAGCAYQNPVSICPHNHMMIPRIIRG
jgi:glutaconyl-CoA decarboxylase